MKVVFLCGSLEPGCDGVGDYTRKLAGELIRQGHEAFAVALVDKHISKTIACMQEAEGASLSVLRIASTCSTRMRYLTAKKWIETVNPDRVSLQFVPFSFHPKGLSIELNYYVKTLAFKGNWHIMFHELWVGMAENDTTKRKVWGKAQKVLIKNLIKRLSPKVIHTQCDLYLEQLKSEKYNVSKLQLFSNIDVVDRSSTQIQIHNKSLNNSGIIKFVFFGSLHPGANLHDLILRINACKVTADFIFEFVYVGRHGDELNNHLTILNSYKIKYTVFGIMNASQISYILSNSTFGISTGSPQMLEKNGTVTAMIAHHLPVICVGRNLLIKKIPELKIPDGTFLLEDFETLFFNRPVIRTSNLLADVASRFINAINQN